MAAQPPLRLDSSMPLRISLVGIGKIARDQHIPALAADPRFELVACASRNATVDGVRNFPDLETLLAQVPGLDCISICTPPQAHFEAALLEAKNAEKGTHIVTIFPDRGDRYLSEGFWNGGNDVQSEVSTLAYETPDQVDGNFTVPDDVLRAIRQHGAAAYPDECCGALIGDDSGLVLEALALSNTTNDERKRRFLIGPDAYRVAEKRASETGRTLLGFYHSHPNHPAVPSAFDLAHAWPNLRYLILSVRGGRPEEARTWTLNEDRSAFDEEVVTISQPQRLRA